MKRTLSCLTASLGSAIVVGALTQACMAKRTTSQIASAGGPTTAGGPGAGGIGDQYDKSPEYIDTVVDSPSDPMLTDSVPLAAYDESKIYTTDIDQHLDHRFDTAADAAALESKAGLAAGAFSSNNFAPLEYGNALAKVGRAPEKFAAASVLAAMRRMRRFYYTVPYKANGGQSFDPTSGAATSYNQFNVVIDDAIGLPRDSMDPIAKGLTKFRTAKLYDAPTVDLDYKDLTHNGGGEEDFVTPFDEFQLTWNSEGTGMDGSNLGVMPPFWDEVQAAFYVEPPHRRHGCWTMGLEGPGVTPGTMGVWAKHTDAAINLSRFAIRDVCTGRLFLPDATGSLPMRPDFDLRQWGHAIAAMPVQLSAYNLMWLDPRTRTFVTPPDTIRNDTMTSLGVALNAAATDPTKAPLLIKTLMTMPAVQWGEAQRAKGMVNMWDYIMLHRLYAWDWKQQRAVLNAYFSDNKMARRYDGTTVTPGDTSPIDVTNVTDCNMWEPVRPGDTQGKQCDDGKVIQGALSQGR